MTICALTEVHTAIFNTPVVLLLFPTTFYKLTKIKFILPQWPELKEQVRNNYLYMHATCSNKEALIYPQI